MHYGRFLAFNVVGGVAWVSLGVMTGYFFGNLPFVRENFSLVVLGIIGVSMIPLLVEWIRHRRAPAA
jgi:membrane-associated protein